jgi:mevalonate kinase
MTYWMTLIHAAIDAGALGAKLTGGGRGGCMIALTQHKRQIAQVVCKALRTKMELLLLGFKD